MVYCKYVSAGTCLKNDVVLTLMRRDDVASTLIHVILAPNAHWGKTCMHAYMNRASCLKVGYTVTHVSCVMQAFNNFAS